jgi:hypothetical protein
MQPMLVASMLLMSSTVFAQCYPVFETEPANQTVPCGVAIPEFDECSASSTCCEGPVEVSTFTSETGAIVHDCIISTAYGPGQDWAFWLPTLISNSVSWHFLGDGHLQVYEDGTGHLWGIIVNSTNASLQFEVDMWFYSGRSWADWSALGRGYKDDNGFAGTNYLNWMYYELVPGFANLKGIGALEGSNLELFHQPYNFYYGFQMGVGANNKNANEGFSGWFTFTGTYNGASVTGHGDVNVNQDCDDGNPGCANTAFTNICRAEDSCGNVAYQSQTVSVVDEIAPLTDPFEETILVACADLDSIYISATDNCSVVLITYMDEVIVPGCGGNVIRHYNVADACGNFITVNQTIYTISEGEPEFTLFPEDTTVSCEVVDVMPAPIIEWTGGCINTQLSSEENIIPGNCPGSYTIQRIYTLTDGCGNEISQTWTITVEDNTPPQLFEIPTDITISCGQEIPPALPFALDNCDVEVNITLNAVTTPLDCGYLFVRTWTATDFCGNTSAASQTIQVSDAIDPFYTFLPPSVTVECGEEFELDLALAFDQCSSVDLAWTDVPLGDCSGSFIRLWRAFDGCGNQALESTTVTKIDNTPPVMTVFPEDLSVSCDAIPEIDPQSIQYMDNCSAVVNVATETIEPGECANSYVLVRTWVLTDECGNSSTWNWRITVTDEEAPILIGIPASASINCGDEVSEAVVVAVDNCDAEVGVTLEATTEPSECGYLFIRTWTATDACGNTVTGSQTIEVNDQQDPVFTFVPEDIAIACGQGITLDDLQLAIATDDCSNVEVTYNDTPLGGNCGDGLLRVFTATDACGNTITAEQIISFSDNISPVFTFVPDDIAGLCGEGAILEEPIAIDDCSTPVITFVDTPGEGCAGSFERVYTATDGCGNTATASVNVSFTDTEAPEILNGPLDVIVNCNEVPSSEDVDIQYFDNCGAVDFAFTETINASDDDCPGSYVITRTWTLTDDCGNSAAYEWNITVSDNTVPTLIGVPANTELSCGEEVSDAVVVAIDNCDDEVLVSLSANTVQNDCGYNFVRTWTAIDDCGNVAEATQTISFTDNDAPFFTFVPGTLILTCDGGAGTPLELATAEDLCSSVVVTYTDEIGSTGCAGGFIRHWIATDGCGNTSVADQQITVNDTQAPIITNFPEDETVSCSEIPSAEDALITFEDDCGNVTTDYSQVIVDGNCANSYNLERTWTFTDACGNSSSQTWTIYVVDEEMPIVIGVPPNAVINCGEEIQDAVVTAIDNCSSPENITISLHAKTTDIPCGYIFVRVWTVTDECGNAAVVTQETTVLDDQDPVFTFVPENIFSECGEEIVLLDAIATDDCSDLVITTSIVEDDDCANSFTRVFTAVDGCGNTTEASQDVTIVDTINPMPSIQPVDVDASCDDLPFVDENIVQFFDACSIVTIEFLTDTIATDCEGNYNIVYTWIATDACLNRTVVDMVVHVTDETAPSFNGLPQDEILECGDALPSGEDVTAFDSCSNATVTFTDEEQLLDCGYVVLRTFIATDDCGNWNSYVQTITFEDNVGPEFNTIPADLQLSCDDIVPSAEIPSATDACTGEVLVDFTEVIVDGICSSNYTIERTYSAVDACGNVTAHTQFIEVSDTEDPDFLNYEPSITIPCTESNSVYVSAFDNCSSVTLTYDDVVSGNSCSGGITRTYTATDACGNAALGIQVMILTDEIAPEFVTFPQDQTFSCSEVPTIDESVVEFIDNCSAVTVSVSENIIAGDCVNSYVLQRTWNISDACNNTNSATWTITVEDIQEPTIIGVPDDITIDCLDDIPAVTVVAIDNCTVEPEITLIATTEDFGCGSVFTRRWIATDECGNLASEIQVITISDLFAPTLSDYPADLVINCGESVPAAPVITASDNCDADVVLTFDEMNNGSIDCPNITRTWCATDCSGNETCHIQQITSEPLFPGIAGQQAQLQAYQSSAANLNIRTQANADSKWRVELYDLTGRMIERIYAGDMTKGEQRQFMFDISQLTDAMYFIQFTNGEELVSKNVVIIR